MRHFLKSSLAAASPSTKARGAIDPKALEGGRKTSIVLIGTSYKTSPLELRERLAPILSGRPHGLRLAHVGEHAEILTCNRMEILLVTDSPDQTLGSFFSRVADVADQTAFYVHKDVDAISHIFGVAAGLDSMVMGEEQILGQVKDAGIKARTSGASRGILAALFDASVNVGRRVRSGPAPDTPPRSVSAFALAFARRRLRRDPRNVLLIGSGKTIKLAATELKGARLFVATRRAELGPFHRAKPIPYKDIVGVADRCDLIISATKHDGYLLKAGDLKGRKRRVILDLAFPRNVDPRLSSASNELYDLDDLARAAPVPPALEMATAERLIAREADSFSRWLSATRLTPTLSSLYRWAENVRGEEADSALRRLPGLSEREKRVVQAMSKRLVSKLMAPPTRFAKASSPELPQSDRLELVQRVFEPGETE